MSKKKVYLFSNGCEDKKLLGGKGAGLCSMTKIGLPVPPGFVITTDACREYYKRKRMHHHLIDEVKKNMKTIEKQTNKVFGNPAKPLLVSVRSGAPVSMPGMMDTVLNLGLNDETLKGLIKHTDERFAYDVYRRFISMFCKIVLNIDEKLFSDILEETKKKIKISYDSEIDVNSLKNIVYRYKEICRKKTGKLFPSDPHLQLRLAIEAVFKSWMGKRCVDYRKEFDITKEMADETAVNVCFMVFGNAGNNSATGVGFTRDPGTGKNVLYGEYLLNAQGEDVVAGIRTPKPLSEMKKEMPKIYKELLRIRKILERHYKEVQDFEFTVEKGKLYMLQTRNAKMNGIAFAKTSVDMFSEGLLTKEEALLRVKPEMLEQLLHRRIDPENGMKPAARGLPASPGAASGIVVFDADEAERKGITGEKVVLVREETKPEDIHGFFRAQGILTTRGGKTSHAAVVARSMGKACVTGASDVVIDPEAKTVTIGKSRVRKGEIITIDGSTGNIFIGEVKTLDPEFSPELMRLLGWADEIRSLGVMANVNTPEDAVKARKFGAGGVGLCRTERMFNQPDRLIIMQEMILAESMGERLRLLRKLLPMQKNDFKKIFRVMNNLPVTIRLLDPPLHEFLPTVEELMHEIEHLTHFKDMLQAVDILPKHLPLLTYEMKGLKKIKDKKYIEKFIAEKENVLRKVRNLVEVNPMLGHRGVRIGITYPEIYEMQTRAIFEASADVIKEGIKPKIEIMVPQVCTAQELKWVKERIIKVNKDIEKETGMKVRYKFGTMIEVVRACMRAGRLAEIAEIFSFGTNDLTQATFSFSREDAENKFLPLYNERKILQDNPFEILDIKGVGRLMMITIEWGRKTRKNLKVGVCGEHGGEPMSIEICRQIGVDYVSCSPYRVPVARLAAAHAEIKHK
ncbi:MAG: pyruvate, phosphate dikinase [Candidatus Thermoplasmatota archaeon]|nr:pyruvate, phosphate dikinase [Candidatus Thermoplasmatota archaeon]